MRLRQGAFSYLPDLTDDEISAQIGYAIDHGWAVAVEFTDDPHPRNFLWEMWGLPGFEMADAAAGLYEVNECRTAYPNGYIRVSCFDSSLGRESVILQFLVHRPAVEPGFALERTGYTDGHVIGYALRSYAAADPPGERYRGNGR
ncbi:ribulose bisphosphate carboxylase small subunit [soil metagenome]